MQIRWWASEGGIMKILELELRTKKLDIMLNFYHHRLGFQLVEQNEDRFSIMIGITKLTFIEALMDENPFYHYAINIPENKVCEALEWFERKVNITKDEGEKIIHFTSWNSHAFYFDDPDGNIIEIIGRHNLKNPITANPFSLESIIAIDEIGVPTNDVMGTLSILKQEFGLPNWRDPYPEFATVGSEEGLFIVVKKGRVWYMSEQAADLFPLTITFLHDKDKAITLENITFKSVKSFQ
jgi:catechol-2,3-dioxygenase